MAQRVEGSLRIPFTYVEVTAVKLKYQTAALLHRTEKLKMQFHKILELFSGIGGMHYAWNGN